MSQKTHSFDFEVHGKVQGVFFRRDTDRHAKKINVNGWVMNTDKGTVVGTAQGSQRALKEMERWLSEEGSKRSKIERCDITNRRSLSEAEFTRFDVRK